MARPPLHSISNTRHWSVLVAPVRLEIVEVMRMIAPCSIAEVASSLDRPADTLYRHIAKLSRAGIVVEAGQRRSGRRYEKIYDLAADDFAILPKEPNGKAANRAFNETLQSILKVAARTARDSAAAMQFEGGLGERNLIGTIEHAWLTPAEYAEIRGLMQAIKIYMDARKARPADASESRLYQTVVMALPVTRKRGSQRATTRSKAGRQPSAKPGIKSGIKPGSKSGAASGTAPASRVSGRSEPSGGAG